MADEHVEKTLTKYIFAKAWKTGDDIRIPRKKDTKPDINDNGYRCGVLTDSAPWVGVLPGLAFGFEEGGKAMAFETTRFGDDRSGIYLSSYNENSRISNPYLHSNSFFSPSVPLPSP